MELQSLDARECFECDIGLMGQSVVVDIFSDASCTVAAHTCFGAVGVEYAHLEVGYVGWEYEYYAVGAYAGVRSAHFYGEVCQIAGRRCQAIDVDVIIAYTMHLSKQDFFHTGSLAFPVTKLVIKCEYVSVCA